jgi:cytochrome c553
MKRVSMMAMVLVLAGAGGVAYAGGDAVAGKAKFAVCAACHGAQGISNNPMWPNLAGQKDGYLVKQLTAFRDGTRKDPIMSPQASALSDADIANLAAYISGLNCK